MISTNIVRMAYEVRWVCSYHQSSGWIHT